DGSASYTGADESVIKFNSNGQIISIRDPNNETRRVSYDGSGSVQKVQGDRFTWTRDHANQSWVQTDNKTGEATAKATDLQVYPNGDVVIVDKDGDGIVRRYRADGSGSYTRPDGSITKLT